ncbi:hypothetical protein [Neochlamydia sp. AcF95]|uniref:hypothetical protein n=1 Tax=Neochlamydia sp. AcF95 TaxID=2795734 RepID=UPI001BC9A325|nr:hypothetical protein [Neochlamydia sp. AcF95]MBS4170812.1 Uncharacterized protein [Neochlamydia sp. AcF95]
MSSINEGSKIELSDKINELASLESISLPRGGTEIESALKLFEQAAKTSQSAPLNLKAMVTILSKEILSYGKQAKDIGVVTGGSSAWNAYQLIKLLMEIKKNNYFENKQLVSLAPANAASQELKDDIDDQLLKAYLKAGVLSLRILKASTLLISHPLIKNSAQSAMDAGTHVLSIYSEANIEKPILRRNPSISTWKDTADKTLKISLSCISLVGSLYAIAASCEWVEDQDPTYELIKKASLMSVATSIVYSVCQQVGLMAKRD